MHAYLLKSVCSCLSSPQVVQLLHAVSEYGLVADRLPLELVEAAAAHGVHEDFLRLVLTLFPLWERLLNFA